mgnify:CR=1 FL=1
MQLNSRKECVNIIKYMKKFMMEALKEAEKAGELGEVPIGAVIVKDGIIMGRGHNLTESAKDPTAHAEMMAIRQAASFLGGWRLSGCDMYRNHGSQSRRLRVGIQYSAGRKTKSQSKHKYGADAGGM